MIAHDLPPEAVTRAIPAAPRGNLSGLTVKEYRTRHGVRYHLVHHAGTGARLLNTTTTALPRALTALEGVDWTRTPTHGTPAYQAAEDAIMAACRIEGVSRG